MKSKVVVHNTSSFWHPNLQLNGWIMEPLEVTPSTRTYIRRSKEISLVSTLSCLILRLPVNERKGTMDNESS